MSIDNYTPELHKSSDVFRGHCAMAPLWLRGKFFEGLQDRWEGRWKGGWPPWTDLG
jgi:hypothetical protein